MPDSRSDGVISQRLARTPRGRVRFLGSVFLAAALPALAAIPVLVSYEDIRPVLQDQREHLPAPLRNGGSANWLAWARRTDKAIRARLEQGDLDSLVNLLLFGTSFTNQPRVSIEKLTEASKSGVLRARVDDLAAGFRNPENNERLVLLRRRVPESPGEAAKFIYSQLLRVLEERKTLAARAAGQQKTARPDDPASILDRESFFSDRGVSLDTGIIPGFTIEETLSDLKQRGVVRDGQVKRVAVIGPGLDFIDKNEESAFDYYPQQTIQPFALYDSLVRLGLARGGSLSVSVFDISPRVIEHVQRARARAARNTGYVIQLPRDVMRPWPPALIAYWNSFGDQVGSAVPPIRPPGMLAGLQTRAFEVRPGVVLACEPMDLDIVVERLNLAAADRFDLIVGTNVFLYYDAFEQSLALENAEAMLKPGGLLLTNDRLPEVRNGSMRLAGATEVAFEVPGVSAPQAVGWYRRE